MDTGHQPEIVYRLLMVTNAGGYVNYGVINTTIWSYDNCWIIAVCIIDFMARLWSRKYNYVVLYNYMVVTLMTP